MNALSHAGPVSARLGLAIGIVLGVATAARAGDVAVEGRAFRLPDGLVIERVAASPIVERPICADFDEQGRLYVADSSGSNEPVAKQVESRPHRLLRLEDRDRDGSYETSTVFADRLMFPEGVLWHAGSVYVAAPPSIWRFTDRDGDGVAEERDVFHDGRTLTGCANDLHGPYLGRDGWIYWCKGAFAEQTRDFPGRPGFRSRASHIFRKHPVTGAIEAVMTGGMDNPVEIAFTPEGERIFTTTFLQHPGGGRRDGLLHAVYGGVYGKPHDVLQGHVRTGDLMPVMTHLGPAAPCGLAILETGGLGPASANDLLACSFNMHKVTRHQLEAEGATFRTADTDWLVSDDVDFHPTDVIEDADGSVLVIDTGGWYNICCPTSHLHKPDVLGAIYRVRRADRPYRADPWGVDLDWKDLDPNQLAERLGDPRPRVRNRAQGLLREAGSSSVGALNSVLTRGGSSVELRRAALWTLAAIDGEGARASSRHALTDPDRSIRWAACHMASLWRDAFAEPALLGRLGESSAHLRRAAAEALGRLGDKASVDGLLAAIEGVDDRVLEHSVIYACIEIGDVASVRASIDHADPHRRRAALIAADQMLSGGLDAPTVVPRLASSDAIERATAIWIVEQHADWAGDVAAFLDGRLRDAAWRASAEMWEPLVARFGGQPEMQRLVARRLDDASAPSLQKIALLRSVGRASLTAFPETWAAPFSGILRSDDRELVQTAVTACSDWRRQGVDLSVLREPLLDVARRETFAEPVRLGALGSIGDVQAIDPSLIDFALGQFAESRPVDLRLRAADILATATLDANRLRALIAALRTLGPMELARVLPAFRQTTDDSIGASLIEAVAGLPAARGVPIATLRERIGHFGEPVRAEGERLFAKLDIDTDAQKAKLAELLDTLPSGDVRRGQTVFYGSKAACSTCHAIGYLGGDIGPDLTRIAGIRTPEDLLESVVFPGASFVRSYEPVLVTTTDGRIYNGTIRNEGPNETTLALAADKFVILPRSSIETIQPSKTSVMPAGLDQQLSVQELADLIEFLKASR
ncbi:MAG: c-type cytochrome [Planctomycetes bacterium]|nr:c-type cytochrome [Planctomycetota bacterium]